MATKISISFKQTTKDQALYNEIMKFEDRERSDEVKRILYKVLIGDKKAEVNTYIEAKREIVDEVDIMNF